MGTSEVPSRIEDLFGLNIIYSGFFFVRNQRDWRLELAICVHFDPPSLHCPPLINLFRKFTQTKRLKNRVCEFRWMLIWQGSRRFGLNIIYWGFFTKPKRSTNRVWEFAIFVSLFEHAVPQPPPPHPYPLGNLFRKFTQTKRLRNTVCEFCWMGISKATEGLLWT